MDREGSPAASDLQHAVTGLQLRLLADPAVFAGLGLCERVVPAFEDRRGIGHARIERFVEMQVIQDLSIVGDRLLQFFEELAQKAHSKILKEGISDSVVSRQVVQLRFFGQDQPLSLDWEADLETAFTSRYQQLYGHIPEVKKIEVVSIRVVVSSVVVENSNNDSSCQDRKTVDVNEVSEMWIQDKWLKASIYDRSETQVGATIAGPASSAYAASLASSDIDL